MSFKALKNSFSSNGNVNLNNTKNDFVDLANTMPYICSLLNAYICSLVSFNEGFTANFFNISALFSLSDNLFKCNFISEEFNQNNLIITTYKIPYKDDVKDKIATFITYYNQNTKILWYILPKEFTNNSPDEVSIASTSKLNDGSYQGSYALPASFTQIFSKAIIPIKFLIPKNNINSLSSIQVLSETDCKSHCSAANACPPNQFCGDNPEGTACQCEEFY